MLKLGDRSKSQKTLEGKRGCGGADYPSGYCHGVLMLMLPVRTIIQGSRPREEGLSACIIHNRKGLGGGVRGQKIKLNFATKLVSNMYVGDGGGEESMSQHTSKAQAAPSSFPTCHTGVDVIG